MNDLPGRRLDRIPEWLRSGSGIAVLFMLVAFAALRIVAVAGLDPVSYPDTRTYFWLDFAGGAARLWTVPLLFRVLPGDGWRVAAELVIGILCWGALAVATARACLRPVVGACGAAAVLLLALTVQVTQWDLILLSESLALSLTALGTALALFAAEKRPSPALVAALLGVVLLWTFTRHINALALGVTFPLVAAALLWRLPRSQALLLVAVLGVVAAWGLLAIRRSAPWVGNSKQLLVERLLQDPGATRYFADRGLPITPELRREVRLRSRLGDFPHLRKSVVDDPRFVRWIDEEWRPAYASYLLKNAPQTVTEPLAKAPRELTTNPAYSKPRAVLPGAVQDPLWNRNRHPLGLLVFAGAAAALWLVSLSRGPPRAAELVPWALIGLGIVLAQLAWTFSATEAPRLFLPAGADVNIGLMLLVVFAADRLLIGGRRAHG